MIKFFRHIRKSLLEQNKMGKYFKYAIGEILLVVIGILIAVSINSYYNKSENEKKIQTILIQVQQELITDIQDARRIYNDFIEKDKIYGEIMLDSSLLKIHEQDPFSFLINTRYVSFSNKRTGYERFMSNLENLPDVYNGLLPHFNHLYVELQNDIDDYNTAIKDAVYNNFFSELKSNPNHSNEIWLEDYEEEKINYHINDPYFKNKITGYMSTLSNIQQAANDYRIESIKLYKKIDSLLGNTSETMPTELKTIPEKNWIKPFIGEYTSTDPENSQVFKLEIKNDALISNGKQIYWHERNIFFIKEGNIIPKLISNEQNEHFIYIKNGPIHSRYQKTLK